MIFSLIVILAIGVIAYFHWVQGLFSALISAVIAVVAALMAVSYHEQLAGLLFATRMTDSGHAISLGLIFAVTYLVLRVTFDSLVPGNVRLPNLLDRAGGALCGLVAGVFAVGTVATAAQSLAFGPAVADYGRYKLTGTRDVKIPMQNRGTMLDTNIYNELRSDKIDPDEAERMLLPADDIVIGLTRALSDGGSLAGDRPLTSVHENYLDELFFGRLGTQVGARLVSINTPKSQQAQVERAFVVEQLSQVDGEISMIRGKRDVRSTVKSDPNNVLLVVRVRFGAGGSDSDKNIRLAPVGVRLFASGKNHLPLGTVQNSVLISNRPDDFLVVGADQAADFAFLVPKSEVFQPAGSGADAGAKYKFVDNSFVEVKRMARTPLADIPVAEGLTDSANGILRKKLLVLTPGRAPEGE